MYLVIHAFVQCPVDGNNHKFINLFFYCSGGKPGDMPQPVTNTLVFLHKLRSEKDTGNVISENLPNSITELFSKTSI